MNFNKVTLINPYPYYAKGINDALQYPPTGLAYIAALLEEYGVECRIIDANILKLNNDEVLEQIKEFNPGLIGITANIVTIKAANELARLLKENTESMIIMGGPYPSSLVEKTLIDSEADCIVRGEGERVVVNIIKQKGNLFKVDGTSYFRNNKLFNNPPEKPIKNLDELPFPAYHLLPSLKLYKSRSRKHPVAPIVTSRGCPYQCIYCNKNIYGNKYRARSPENVVEEIEHLTKKFGVKQISILDDNFTLDIERAEKICDLIVEKKIKIVIDLQNGIRADKLTPRLVEKMKKAGVFKVGLGIESGDPKILESIKKSLKLEDIEKAVKLLKEKGIIIHGYFMLGLPGETQESMQKTIDFAKKINPNVANFMVTLPLPGTELYDIIKREGNFKTNIEDGSDVGFYSDKFSFEMGKVNEKTVHKYLKKAYRSFYFRPIKMMEMGLSLRSINEFKWAAKSALPLLMTIFKKK